MKSMLIQRPALSKRWPVFHWDLWDDYPLRDALFLPEIWQRDHHKYRLNLQLPQLRKKDISLRVDGDALLIEGSRKETHTHRYLETAVRKRFPLLEDMETDHIKAKYRNGELRIQVPRKKELVTYREIPISEPDAIDDSATRELKQNWLSHVKDRLKAKEFWK